MALLTVSKESALTEAVNSVYRASVLGIVSSVVISKITKLGYSG